MSVHRSTSAAASRSASSARRAERVTAVDSHAIRGLIPRFGQVLTPWPDDPGAFAQALTVRAPRAVALPLLALEFDVMDLLAELDARRYPGRVLVIGPPLPRRKLVARELRVVAPGLRLYLILMADPAG